MREITVSVRVRDDGQHVEVEVVRLDADGFAVSIMEALGALELGKNTMMDTAGGDS